MRIWGACYHGAILTFCETREEALLAALEYASKVGPDPSSPRKGHFLQWLSARGASDGPEAWKEYVGAIEDASCGVLSVAVPRRSVKALVCMGAETMRESIAQRLADAGRPVI